MKGFILLTCGHLTDKGGLSIIGKFQPTEQSKAMDEAQTLTQTSGKPHHVWTLVALARPIVTTTVEWDGPNGA